MTRLESFGNLSVLVIGDIMLDRFVYGSVDRINPESPAPLISMSETRSMLGGVGNVARNLAALGASVSLHTCIGDDAPGKEIIALIGKETSIIGNIITETGRPSTLKVRYIAHNQQMLRADHETKRSISQASNRRILGALCGEFDNHDAVILSDYKKGVLTPELIRLIINFAREHDLPVIIDPKPRHCGEYRGATVITPNLSELQRIALISGCPYTDIETDEDILEATFWLAKEHDIDHILVTRSEKGMTIVSREGGFSHIPARAHQIVDVSGAGDTVIATLTLALANGMSVEEAAELANTAAGIAVERAGTSIVSQHDLQLARISAKRIGGMHKIVSLDAAVEIAKQWRREGRVVGFANGCFDIFHAGHSHHISEARERCDRLVIALNSDTSVRLAKGNDRPIIDQYERAMILATHQAVDLIVIFDEPTPIKQIQAIRPDILFKGSDYKAEDVAGYDFIKSIGGEVQILQSSRLNSTTNIIKKIRSGLSPSLVVNNQQ